jgi:hypothetical protein
MAWLSLEKNEKTDLCLSMKSSFSKLKAKGLYLECRAPAIYLFLAISFFWFS